MLFVDEQNKTLKILTRDSLLLNIFLRCSMRARRKLTVSKEGLMQGEFFLSLHEFKKFGLKKTQKGKIARALKKLITLGLIVDTGKRMGEQHSNVYRFLQNDIIDINFEVCGTKKPGDSEFKAMHADTRHIRAQPNTQRNVNNITGSDLTFAEFEATMTN